MGICQLGDTHYIGSQMENLSACIRMPTDKPLDIGKGIISLYPKKWGSLESMAY
jgi:hypothetical protein